MGLSAVTYALAKKYTDDTVIGLGGLKGAPCKVKSVIKNDGRSIVTLEWEDSTGGIYESYVYVNDGISTWISGRDYAINDIVIKDEILYACKTANSDIVFDESKWTIVSSGVGDYYIINTLSERPSTLSPTDRKIYYCIETNIFYLWNGTKWSDINTGIKIKELTQAEYDALPDSEKMNGTLYFVTDAGGSETISYNDLIDLPQINGVTLKGNKTSDDLYLSSLEPSQLSSLLDLI